MNDAASILGYGADPAMMYGPSAGMMADGAARNPLEPGTNEYAPLTGPAKIDEASVSGKPVGFAGFLGSPAGLLVVILPLALLAFDRVFGVRG